jgi:hypothetical protein
MTKEEDQRTKDIINRLEALSIETNELLTELRGVQRPQPPADTSFRSGQTDTTRHHFRTGDRVIIANNYLRQRNIQGRVIYTTAQRVTLIDDQGNRYTRKPTNLRKL